MFLVTDASLTADLWVGSSIQARSHTFLEIDHELISSIILLPSAESFKKGCCQLQVKVCARKLLVITACSSLPREKCGKVIDPPAMTIDVELGRKATNEKKCTQKSNHFILLQRVVLVGAVQQQHPIPVVILTPSVLEVPVSVMLGTMIVMVSAIITLEHVHYVSIS